jgi:hypothetical protein
MALKRLKVKMTTPGVKPGDIPVVNVESDLISQYNKADAQKKAAEGVMNDLKPEILELGLSEVFKRSCADPLNPTPTVKLQDDEGEVLRVEFTKRYGNIPDDGEADELFEQITDGDGNPVDINRYVQEVVVAKFDDKVFYDAEGNFVPKVYDTFRKAVEEVSRKLGVACPRETTKVFTPKEVFHMERFKTFPDPDVQAKLTVVMPNVTRIVPVTVNKTKPAK